VSAAAGLGTLYLVSRGAYYSARPVAALSVAAVVAGWGAAQRPVFLPGLTIHQAAAGHSTLVALLIGIAIGGLVLVPSLTLLFSLVQRGRFSAKIDIQAERPKRRRKRTGTGGAWLGGLAAVSFVLGVGLEVLAGSSWALGLGIASLFVSMAAAFGLIVGPTGLIALDSHDDRPSVSVPRKKTSTADEI
jgi:cytochrome bd ubiquinol oxidase subunit II